MDFEISGWACNAMRGSPCSCEFDDGECVGVLPPRYHWAYVGL
jgi:hypothetical protein